MVRKRRRRASEAASKTSDEELEVHEAVWKAQCRINSGSKTAQAKER